MNKKFSILSFRYAFEGLVSAFKEEPNLKFHFLVGILVIILGCYLNITRTDWLILIILIGFVIATLGLIVSEGPIPVVVNVKSDESC